MANKKITKILVFNQTFGLGGAETFLTDLLAEFMNKGVEVTVHTNNQSWKKILQKQQISVFKVPFDLDVIGDWKGLVKAIIAAPFALCYFAWIIITTKTDLILFPTFGDKILGSMAAAFLHKPVIWIEFGPLASVFKKFNYLPQFLYRLVKDYPKLVITSSAHSRSHLIAEANFDPSRIIVIPCGRSLPSQVFGSAKCAQLITCISRLEPGKGQDLLIQAMTKIKQKFPQAKLRIVGEGDWMADLLNLKTKLNLQDCVELTGRVGDSWSEIAQAQVIVCPSMWELEGFGMVAIEAMAMSKPVVGFDRGPTNEIVLNHQTGLLAKPGDIDDLAKQITNLIDHPQLAKRYGQQGRQVFAEKYQIGIITQKYLHAIEKSI